MNAKIETLVTGLAENVKPSAFDDMRFLDELAEFTEEKNPLVMVKLFNRILNPKDKARLYKALETKEGNVPMEAASDALLQIIKRSGKLKK